MLITAVKFMVFIIPIVIPSHSAVPWFKKSSFVTLKTKSHSAGTGKRRPDLDSPESHSVEFSLFCLFGRSLATVTGRLLFTWLDLEFTQCEQPSPWGYLPKTTRSNCSTSTAARKGSTSWNKQKADRKTCWDIKGIIHVQLWEQALWKTWEVLTSDWSWGSVWAGSED